jgi:hypothetical protein
VGERAMLADALALLTKLSREEPELPYLEEARDLLAALAAEGQSEAGWRVIDVTVTLDDDGHVASVMSARGGVVRWRVLGEPKPAPPPAAESKCEECNGHGWFWRNTRAGEGLHTKCPDCKGTGRRADRGE